MNQELRALQATRWHEENQERRSEVGYGKDEPNERKLSVRRRGMVCDRMPTPLSAGQVKAVNNRVCVFMYVLDVRLLRYSIFPMDHSFFRCVRAQEVRLGRQSDSVLRGSHFTVLASVFVNHARAPLQSWSMGHRWNRGGGGGEQRPRHITN